MTIYYIVQDNTVWGCGDPECCGEYYEEIVNDFVKCDCLPQSEMTADHLQGCNGGGPVLKWRVANEKEVLAFNAGVSEGWDNGFNAGFDRYSIVSEKHIMKVIEKMPEDYWAKFAGFGDKLDRQELIVFIKGENND